MRNVAAANTKADIHFIAAARDLVPALLAERDDYADQLGELVPALNREAVEQRARAEAAEAERDRAMQACGQIAARLDAALAEVARLSTPPDDAEVAVLEGWLRNPWSKAAPGSERGPIPEWVYALLHQAADHITRLSHAHAAERKLADDLIGIVEGIDGAMNHGTWRDDHGARLKDTPQWVAFYIAAHRKE